MSSELDTGPFWWWSLREKLDAEDRDRQEWLRDVKRRLGIVCIGDTHVPARALPDWPVLPEGTTPEDWQLISEYAMASRDGVNFYVKPEGMSLAEFWDSIP